ncbi:MAG: MBL fold metallo-hydrolase [Nitrososphaerales archaeon]|nr:MBL fold metallo-hydrolase [Nitrososphaerales archaeon]
MTGLNVFQLKVGPIANFVYLLVDVQSMDAVVVDSGWETGPIVEAAKANGARVRLVVASHEHFDHTSTLRKLAEETGAKVAAHASSPIDHDISLRDGGKLEVGRNSLRVMHTPGHTEDSICLYDGREVFTGDTLFVGTIGKFERSGAEAIYHSLHDAILKLPDSTLVYPGHDYGSAPFRSIGEERLDNPYLAARDLREFISLFA